MEVICGAKVTGVTKRVGRAEEDEKGAGSSSDKAYTVTFQQSSGGGDSESSGGGVTGGGQVLKSSRSSLYNSLRTEEGVGGRGGGRLDKATVSIECDRVIMATGSSRYSTYSCG